MSLLVDRAQPNSFEQVVHNALAVKCLRSMALNKDISLQHMIIEGPRGCGKRTLLRLFLQARFQDIKTKSFNMEVQVNKDAYELPVLVSNHHYQFNPGVHGIYDRTLIQSFIKEVTTHHMVRNANKYKIVVIEEADLLSREAQESLHKLLETHVANCRFIFLSNREGRIIDPIISRCFPIHITAPTTEEVASIVKSIVPGIPQKHMNDLIVWGQWDLRRTLNFVEKYIYLSPSPDLMIQRQQYDNVYHVCSQIVQVIIRGNDIENVMKTIRDHIYKLVNTSCNLKQVMTTIIEVVFQHVESHAHRLMLCEVLVETDLSIHSSSKEIYHVEELCIKAFQILKHTTLLKKQIIARKKP
jgi:replication factor C subunit 3/5